MHFWLIKVYKVCKDFDGRLHCTFANVNSFSVFHVNNCYNVALLSCNCFCSRIGVTQKTHKLNHRWLSEIESY